MCVKYIYAGIIDTAATLRRKRRNGLPIPAPIVLIVGPFCLELCMACAKKISSVLDVAIERIESKYVWARAKGR